MITPSDTAPGIGPLSYSTRSAAVRMHAGRPRGARSLANAFALALSITALTAPVPGAGPGAAPWAEWIEPNFPFVSSVVDARKAGAQPAGDNLTPRGLVLN